MNFEPQMEYFFLFLLLSDRLYFPFIFIFKKITDFSSLPNCKWQINAILLGQLTRDAPTSKFFDLNILLDEWKLFVFQD